MFMSPKAALLFVQSAIQKTIGQKVDNFDVIYRTDKRTIDFRLYNYKDANGKVHDTKMCKYSDSEGLCNAIDTMLKGKITTGDTIDMVVANLKKAEAELFITKADKTKEVKILVL